MAAAFAPRGEKEEVAGRGKEALQERRGGESGEPRRWVGRGGEAEAGPGEMRVPGAGREAGVEGGDSGVRSGLRAAPHPPALPPPGLKGAREILGHVLRPSLSLLFFPFPRRSSKKVWGEEGESEILRCCREL